MLTGSAVPATPPLILDGGTGSELRRRGVALSTICWSAAANLDHAGLLAEIHSDYIDAGADIVTANTFATARFVLEAAGLEARFEAINKAALKAARRAADASDREVRVAASLSCFPPDFDRGAYPDSDREYRDYHDLATLFASNGVDLILLEMLQDPMHAELSLRAAAESGLPFWAGISCRLGSPNTALVAFDTPGQPIADVIELVVSFAPAGVAIMHTPVAAVGPALALLRASWSGPVGAYPETGYSEDPDAVDAKPISPEDLAAYAADWLDAGVSLLGGCCGTTPAHTRALRALVDGH